MNANKNILFLQSLYILVILFLIGDIIAVFSQIGDKTCNNQFVIEYSVTLTTSWSSHQFPKQYPTHRPQAQWSGMLGYSHDESYTLWQFGFPISRELRLFIVSGDSSSLQQVIAQGSHGVLDTFNTKKLSQGVGVTSATFFTDSKHSKVSVLSRLIPSPDWFVGLDSYDLCISGQWVNNVSIGLPLYDAGVDKGYSFTSPDWFEYPLQPVSKITSLYPNHTSSSFYYPSLSELPQIASVQFTILRSLVETSFSVNDREESGDDDEIGRKKEHNISWKKVNDDISRKRGADVKHKKDNESIAQNNKQVHVNTSSLQLTSTTNDGMNEVTMPNVVDMTQTFGCVVGEWSEWSICPVSCGYSTSYRTRKVIVSKPIDDCPILNETKTCGTMRGCKWNYFNNSLWH